MIDAKRKSRMCPNYSSASLSKPCHWIKSAVPPVNGGSDSTDNGFLRSKNVTLYLCQAPTYREIVDWASELERVRGLLQLSRTAFPVPSTLYRSFERVPISLWRSFLWESANICDPGSHEAIDATFLTEKGHRGTTDTARVATYARSKRRRSSIRICVPSSIFTD